MTQLYFYPTYVGIVTRNFQTKFQIFGKLENGERIHIVDNSYALNFYIAISDSVSNPEEFIKHFEEKDNNRLILKIEKKSEVYFGKEREFFHVYVNTLTAFRKLTQIMKEVEEIEILAEADFDVVSKYMAEKGISLFTLHYFEGTKLTYKSRMAYVFELEHIELESKDVIDNLNTLSLGFEYSYEDSDEESIPINTFILRTKNFERTITRIKVIKDNVEYVASEYDLIIRFKEILEGIKPDFLVGYDINSFLHNIKNRAIKYKIPFDLGYDHSNIAGMNDAKINGVQIIDFGMFKKEIRDLFKFSMYEDEIEEVQAKSKIFLDEFSLVKNYIYESCKLFHAPPNILLRSKGSRLVDLYFMKEYKEYGQIIPPIMEQSQKFKLDFDFVSGFHNRSASLNIKNIFVDLLINDNVSVDSFRCSCCEAFCKHSESKIKKILVNLDSRIYRLKDMTVDDAIDMRLKILERVKQEVSSYLFSSVNRFFNENCVDFVQKGVLQQVNKLMTEIKLKELEFRAFHDFRLFIDIDEKLVREIREIVASANKSVYLENIYNNLLVLKSGQIACKNKNVLFSNLQPKASRLSRESMQKFLNILFDSGFEHSAKYLKYLVKKILTSNLNLNEFIIPFPWIVLQKIKTDLYRQIIEYYKKDRRLEYSKLDLVVIEGTESLMDRVRPVHFANNPDVQYYLQEEIEPVFNLILEVFDKSFKEIVESSEQPSLNNY